MITDTEKFSYLFSLTEVLVFWLFFEPFFEKETSYSKVMNSALSKNFTTLNNTEVNSQLNTKKKYNMIHGYMFRFCFKFDNKLCNEIMEFFLWNNCFYGFHDI